MEAVKEPRSIEIAVTEDVRPLVERAVADETFDQHEIVQALVKVIEEYDADESCVPGLLGVLRDMGRETGYRDIVDDLVFALDQMRRNSKLPMAVSRA